ncbi:MAG: helix-turn-helix domain-containing protein [Nitrospirota bacterium]|nr:helix-turn-helix domain-containing protein [Nitrospirota bacterium]
MKRRSSIQIYWDNPPSKRSGVTVRRSVAGGVYERKVSAAGLLSSAEAAEAIGITLRHLYNLMNDGTLKPRKKSGKLFFRLAEIKQYLSLKRLRSGKPEPWLIG